jgi:hypothetical protein
MTRTLGPATAEVVSGPSRIGRRSVSSAAVGALRTPFASGLGASLFDRIATVR